MMNQLRERAIELGLQGFGIAPAINEVQELYPWAKSVIVGAISYLSPEDNVNGEEPRGLIARVARSADYHTVLREKLTHLAGLIQSEHPQAKLEICVDTSPIPERKLAVLSGIAWRGKNGNVFVENCGSYAALGEIITDLDLPVDNDNVSALKCRNTICESCNKCISSCPTHAITAPYTIDTSRCLSQLTQTSGIIPHKFRRLMGNRIYGCDTCQEVCPQNAGIKPINPEFAECTYPELIPLIKLSAKDFKEKIKDTSIGWIRRTRIRRNAAIAAGNMKYEKAIPALAEMLEDENPVLRISAAWALGEIGSQETFNILKQALAKESDPQVIEEIQAALSKSDKDTIGGNK